MLAGLQRLPPLLVVGGALLLGGLAGLPGVRTWRISWQAGVLGVAGMFGYHYVLFTALKIAPSVETNLINYLWPLLIVLLSPLFIRGKPLAWYHVLGAVSGLAGAVLIFSGGRLGYRADYLPGYLLAALAALIWACYSLGTRIVPHFSSSAVSAFCLGGGALSLLIYSISGGSWQVIGQMRPIEWLWLVLLGLGPNGLAFISWDAALKRTDARIIGAISYLTPLLSTVWLVLIAGRSFQWTAGAALGLILGGAVIGSADLYRTRA